MTPAWWRREEADLHLLIHAQPGAKRNAIAGLHNGRLKVKIAAPPVDGKANGALCRFLSAEFGVPLRQVRVVSGHSGRDKQLVINQPASEPVWLQQLGAGG